MPRPIALLGLILLLPSAALSLETAEEIVACIEANQPVGSSIQTIAMRSKDRTGAATNIEAKLYWQQDEDGRSMIHMAFDAPDDLRGSKLLMLEKEGRNETFMYLPELKKTRRVSSRMMSGSMFGTDFSYEEFERLQGISKSASTERGGDVEIDGRTAYTLIQVTDDDSEYATIRSSIDRETCVPLSAEFIDKAGRVHKVLTTDWSQVTREGKQWVARRMTMADQIEGTETELEIRELEFGAEIPRRYFSQSSLRRD